MVFGPFLLSSFDSFCSFINNSSPNQLYLFPPFTPDFTVLVGRTVGEISVIISIIRQWVLISLLTSLVFSNPGDKEIRG